jgi:hypothetical protein
MIIGSVKSEYQRKYHASEISARSSETRYDSVGRWVDMRNDSEIGSVPGVYIV